MAYRPPLSERAFSNSQWRKGAQMCSMQKIIWQIWHPEEASTDAPWWKVKPVQSKQSSYMKGYMKIHSGEMQQWENIHLKLAIFNVNNFLSTSLYNVHYIITRRVILATFTFYLLSQSLSQFDPFSDSWHRLIIHTQSSVQVYFL